jgi:hypothetical protein
MSIDWDKPVSDEDKEWVRAQGSVLQRRELDAYEARQSSVEKVASGQEADNQPQDDYDDMTVDELKAEAADRKRRDPDFDTKGITKKSELVERLREWDNSQEQ